MARLPNIEKMADQAVRQFSADLAQVIVRLRRYLEELAAKLHADGEDRLVSDEQNTELAAKMEADLSNVLAELGYDGAIGNLLDSFERVKAALDVALAEQLGANAGQASTASLEAGIVESVRAMLNLKGDAAGKLHEVLILGARTAVPRADLLEQLARAAEVTLKQSVTLADTALMGFHREVTVTQAQEAGLDLLLYDGPDDDIARPFCHRHVTHVFTAADLNRLDNGQKLQPTILYMGGYNCRHYPTPITLAMAQEMDPSLIEGREARAIVFRGRRGTFAIAAGVDERGVSGASRRANLRRRRR